MWTAPVDHTRPAIGNLTYDITTLSGVTTTRVSGYPAASNRITDMTQNGAALSSYTYDNAGNIITDLRPGAETFAYTYNKRNRLSSVTRNGAAYATYIYNALEQMVSRVTSASGGPVGTVHYVYDTDGHLIVEADAATGASLREYIWLPANDNTPASGNDSYAETIGVAANDNDPPDLPLAVINVAATPTIFQVHTDHLGRPIRLTDAAKATVWQAQWKAWGEPHSITGTQAQNLRFPGQYFQIETGLSYNHHRHYDPITGRYTQPDPLRFVDGPSVYAYAGSSPMIKTDRDGRKVLDFDGKMRDCLNCPSGGGGSSGGGGLFDWMFPPQSQPAPQMCMGPSDKQALEACEAAAEGDDRDWLNFCDASKWAGRVDHTRPQRCRDHVYSSPGERQNFCFNEFGD
jgi:RHS repeat-associated protein